MKTYTREELFMIILDHKKWLDSDGREGKRADLSNSDLRGFDFSSVNLQNASMRGSNLRETNFTHANMRGMDLSEADMGYVNLCGAYLRDAYLGNSELAHACMSYADIRGANLSGANLFSANFAFGSFPFGRGSLNIHIDDSLAIQLLYYTIRNVQYSKNTSDRLKKILANADLVALANEFPRCAMDNNWQKYECIQVQD